MRHATGYLSLRDSACLPFLMPLRSPSAFTTTPSPPQTPEDKRREVRILIGRASFNRRRKNIGLQSSNEDDDNDNDTFMDEEVNRIAEVVVEPTQRWPRRKRKPEGLAEDTYRPSDVDEDENTDDNKPARRSGKRSKKEHVVAREAERPKKSPGKAKRAVKKVRSRFIEGSMNDRTSKKPPSEIIGTRHGDYNYDDSVPAHEVHSAATAFVLPCSKNDPVLSKGFRFGLENVFTFNPLRLAINIKTAYQRQKAQHEARDRAKREAEKQKQEIEARYQEMKRSGAFTGRQVYRLDELRHHADDVDTNLDVNVDGFGRTTPTEPNSLVGTTKKRRRSEPTTSVASAAPVVPTSALYDDEGYEGYEGYEEYEEMVRFRSVDENTEVLNHTEELENELAMNDKGKDKVKRKENEIPSVTVSSSDTKRDETARFPVKRGPKAVPNLANSSISVNTPSLGEEAATHKLAKPLTKREVQKKQRLLRKVSTLEEQLAKAKHELGDAWARSLLSVPKIPRALSQSSSSKVSCMRGLEEGAIVSSQGSSVNSVMMPPQPPKIEFASMPTDMPRSSEETKELANLAPVVPRFALEHHLVNTKKDLADAQASLALSSPDSTEVMVTPILSSLQDASLDEGFSMLPLSPIISHSMLSGQGDDACTVTSKAPIPKNMLPENILLDGLGAKRDDGPALGRRVANAISHFEASRALSTQKKSCRERQPTCSGESSRWHAAGAENAT